MILASYYSCSWWIDTRHSLLEYSQSIQGLTVAARSWTKDYEDSLSFPKSASSASFSTNEINSDSFLNDESF